jgi:hydroxymethylpyrimidine pyrophosphatase-like HAD family hydrolase
MNLSDRDLFTTGDGGNDLAMLKMAKKSFTAITRPDDIKGQVDHVIDPTKEGLLTPIN